MWCSTKKVRGHFCDTTEVSTLVMNVGTLLPQLNEIIPSTQQIRCKHNILPGESNTRQTSQLCSSSSAPPIEQQDFKKYYWKAYGDRIWETRGYIMYMLGIECQAMLYCLWNTSMWAITTLGLPLLEKQTVIWMHFASYTRYRCPDVCLGDREKINNANPAA